MDIVYMHSVVVDQTLAAKSGLEQWWGGGGELGKVFAAAPGGGVGIP